MSEHVAVVSLACLVVLTCNHESVAENIAPNPGFEIAGDTELEAAAWISGANTLGTAQRSSNIVHSGEWSFYLSASGGQLIDGEAQLIQSSYPVAGLGIPSLQEQTELSFSFFANHDRGTGELGRARIQIINSNGTIIDNGRGIAIENTNGKWVEHTLDPLIVPSFGPVPNDAFYYQVIISVESQVGLNSFIEAYIDDVVIDATLVPEPSSCALIAFCCLPFIQRTSRGQSKKSKSSITR